MWRKALVVSCALYETIAAVANEPPETRAGRDSAMQHSTTRILTTHTGSLPRPQDLLHLLIEEQARPGMDRTALDAALQRAVTEVVQKQADTGLDVINDGEQGRVDYTVYIKDRLTGFDGESAPPLGTGDAEFPELAAILRALCAMPTWLAGKTS